MIGSMKRSRGGRGAGADATGERSRVVLSSASQSLRSASSAASADAGGAFDRGRGSGRKQPDGEGRVGKSCSHGPFVSGSFASYSQYVLSASGAVKSALNVEENMKGL